MIANVRLIEPVSMIVLTGGPCSGKSSSLAYLTERLSDHGFLVFIVPETATLITSTGIDRRKMDRTRQVVMFEETIFDMQLAFEETYKKAVTGIFPDRRKVILLDRGIMDIKAFIPHEDFRAMLNKRGLSEVDVRDRYNGVIHLVTAAEGAEEYYTGENNAARIESPEEARSIDRKTRESWLGHPHFKIIDNRTDFEGKIKRTFETISEFLGIHLPLDTKEKYLVRSLKYDMLPAHQVIQMEEAYLRARNRAEEVHIRKRGQHGSYLYFLSRKRATRHGEAWIEEEELIAEQEYLTLKNLIDPKTDIVEKERICFLWDNRYFELDRYGGRWEGLVILKAEYDDSAGDGEASPIPGFIDVGDKITGDPRYLTRSMAVKPRKLTKSPGARKKNEAGKKGPAKDS
jgi:CYTH domain-containing protein/predicted ATPase